MINWAPVTDCGAIESEFAETLRAPYSKAITPVVSCSAGGASMLREATPPSQARVSD